MKHTLTFLFLFWFSFGFSQQSNNLEKDIILANYYFAQAEDLIHHSDTSCLAIEKLQKAHDLYERYGIIEKLIATKGLWAFAIWSKNRGEEAQSIALAAIELAKSEFKNKEHPFLKYPFRAMQVILLDEDPKVSVDYGLKAMAFCEKGADEYFMIAEKVLRNIIYDRKLEISDSMIIELENILADKPASKNWLAIYRAKMQLFTQTQNFEKAIIYGEKLIAENEKFEKYPPDVISTIYVELGNCYGGLGQNEQAIDWMKRGLSEAENLNLSKPILGTYHGNLGLLYSRFGNLQKSIEHYKIAAGWLKLDEANFRGMLKIIYQNLGIVYLKLGDLDEAENSMRAAQKYGETSVMDYYNLAIILNRQKQYEASLELFQNALLLTAKHFKDTSEFQNPTQFDVFRDKFLAGSILLSKGVALHYLGNEKDDLVLLKKGVETLKVSAEILQQHSNDAVGFEQSRFIINKRLLVVLKSIVKLQYDIYRLYPSTENANAFFEAVERKKGLQLLETISPKPLPKELFDEEEKLHRDIQLAGLKLDLAIISQQEDSTAFYREKLFEANQKLEEYFKKIENNYPKEANHFYEYEHASIQDIQQKLDTETLFIEYSIDKKALFINTISKEHAQIFKIDTTASSIVQKIETLNKLLKDPFAFQKKIRESFIEVSHELYEILIRPIEEELKGKRKLMIAVEGQLFHLPFELLLNTDEKKSYQELSYLLKNFEINYHYSGTAYLKLGEKPAIKDQSLLAFAPVFEKNQTFFNEERGSEILSDSLYLGVGDNYFVHLPNTEKEVKTIAKLLGFQNKTKVLLQAKATKENLTKSIENKSYQFIHIATHGFVNYENSKLSSLACHPSENSNQNLWYAQEIQLQDLKADLVVLSSCESGIGKLVEGEGLIALNRSFIYAGAKNVLYSLWKVNDRLSSKLMIEFYKNYLKGMSYTSALRSAKFEMLKTKESALPKYWSAFILMGE